MTSHRWAVLFLGAALLSAGAAAQYRPLGTAPGGSVPGGVHYQGRLEDNGYPATGLRNMTFRLYDAPAGGNLLWNSGALPVAISQGIFGVDLNISTPALAGAGLKYLEVTIDATTLAPREALGAVPYAMVAKAVEGTLDLVGGGLSVSSATTSGSASLFVSSTSGSVGIMNKTPATLMHMSSGTLTIDGNVADSIVAVGAIQTPAVRGGGNLNLTSGNAASRVVLQINGVEGARLESTRVFYLGAAGTQSSFATTGALTLAADAALTASGANGKIISASSVNASGFFGDGTGLTNVSGTNIQNLTVDTTKLAADAVSGPKILSGAVDTNKLAPDAVTSEKILVGAVQTAKLGADAVTSAALMSDAGSLTKVSGGVLASAAGKLTLGGAAGTNQVSAWLSATQALQPGVAGTLAANTCWTSAAIPVTGAVDGGECYVGVPNANALVLQLIHLCYVSAAGQVTVKACCIGGAPCNGITSQTYRVTTFLH